MQRRQFLRNSLAATLLANPTLRLFSQSQPIAEGGDFQMIRGNVGYYTNRGGTIGLYLPDGKPRGGVIVDTQFPDAAEELLATLRELGDLTQFAILANTHHHGDHTGGNAIIAPLAKQYIMHDVARESLLATLAANDKIGSIPLPKTTFSGTWSTNLPQGKEVVALRHFGAAHTGGDVVVHFENANVAHLGDLLFNRRFPYIDTAAGGDILNWPVVLRKIRIFYGKNTLYIFGHAADGYPVFGTTSDIKAFENYLERLQIYVRKEIRKGTSLVDLKAKTETIPGAPTWNFGERLRDLNLEVMYGALSE
ncbi:MBL fold metallo-hydrolase [Neolewinella antarctica]|uniref:Glyoxylase-like metal-dependent hydrolase (Beta-lactamase superfamily II) n=1 Tax=Neolewinella antarctica TaxID=442734 RepID=A0ABX0X7S1_9BACT|nr:MBL fold metallo-hydrolase [Neolewinella antarctica]NJC25275.1 glyoxylase-like metal-dependent hydrolase (beta-lactamase superfamily II) [Neolewinella antarctica]